jgi:hypothetical protein
MTDEPTLAELGARRAALLREVKQVTDAMRPAALRELATGRSEVEVAREAKVDRLTLRSWRGRPRKPQR